MRAARSRGSGPSCSRSGGCAGRWWRTCAPPSRGTTAGSPATPSPRMPPTRRAPEAAVLRVRVQPRAARAAITGWRDDALAVRVTAPPVDGAANAAVSALLAEALDVPPSRVRVVRGERGRDKLVRIEGLSLAGALARLGRIAPG